MKTLRMIGVALVAVVLSVGFCACSDDDDKDNGGLESQLKGTTWKITSDTGYEDYAGMFITFNKDYTATSTTPDSWDVDEDGEWDDWDYGVFWSVSGDVLTIDWDHDDCIEGTFVIDGKKATYTYHWFDYDKEWSNKEYYIMTLEKQ